MTGNYEPAVSQNNDWLLSVHHSSVTTWWKGTHIHLRKFVLIFIVVLQPSQHCSCWVCHQIPPCSWTELNPCHAECFYELLHSSPIFVLLFCNILVVSLYFQSEFKTVWIQISWLPWSQLIWIYIVFKKGYSEAERIVDTPALRVSKILQDKMWSQGLFLVFSGPNFRPLPNGIW